MLRKFMKANWRRRWAISAALVLVSACEMPLTAPTPTLSSVPQVIASETPASSGSPSQIYLPEIEKPPTDNSPASGSNTPAVTQPLPETDEEVTARLAFLKNGDLWLVELPQPAPRQLTSSSDLMTFAWSPDGSRIATFNGRSLCFVDAGGTQTSECIGLGLTDEQSIIPRGIVWSPDQQTIVLWNLANPWDDQSLGWLVVSQESPQEVLRIADPGEFGPAFPELSEPGGFTGQPAFLADGTLIGTLSHRQFCGDGGCRYQLYSFDLAQQKFSPYSNNPEEGWSEGQNLVLSPNRGLLADFGTFFSECDSFVTFADTYDLATGKRSAYNLELEAVTTLDFSSDASQAIISRVSGCPSPAEQTTWDRACGLSQGFDVFPLQLWDLETDTREDLYPGVSPDWSPSQNLIAFRSCLAENASGAFEPSASGPPLIYVLDLDSGGLLQIGEGLFPAWSPE